MTQAIVNQNLESYTIDLTKRPRRNRKSAAIREIVRETRLHPSQLVAPLFLLEGEGQKEAIPSMPKVFRRSIDLTITEVLKLYQVGIRAIDLFPVIPEVKKDRYGSEAVRENNLLQQAVKAIKREIPEMCVMIDVALDPYTDHGHDGVVDEKGNILNDPTVKILAEMSVHAANAGADFIAPSDMMDGRIAYIRNALDNANHQNTGILSYAAKYASALYGPFRDALHSAPKFGDKKTYQMDPANSREAMMECSLDEWEGADILMIKPALAYLDIITKLREQTELPIAAYHVSGEYAMIMAAHQNGWLDGERAMEECLTAIKRAGADMIFTYAAQWIAEKIQSR